MSYDYNTISELAGKVDWEGGIDQALDYGIRSSDIADTPELAEVKRLWIDLENAHAAIQPIAKEIGYILDEAQGEASGNTPVAES